MRNTVELAVDILEKEEGYREFPYLCSEGYPTIGIGMRIGPKGADLKMYTFSISAQAAKAWCEDRVRTIDINMMKYPFYRGLDTNRKAIIISMSYQLGIVGVLKFKNMVAALEEKDYTRASIEALDSKWARQTPARAARHAESLKTGIVTY